MNITREEITHLAKLSNFSLSEHEMDTLARDLEKIVDYISELKNLDTEGIGPTYQAFDLANIWRNDEPVSENISREQLLDLTTASTNHQIKVPKVL